MPRALARSAYGTSRRIGEAGVSIARRESLTLLNATPLTFALSLTPRARRPESQASSVWRTVVGHQIHTEQPRIRVLLGKTAHRIYQSFPFAQARQRVRGPVDVRGGSCRSATSIHSA